jgi:hypothetical protein
MANAFNRPKETPMARTREQALAERHRLTNDIEFIKKFAAGDVEANKLVETLAREIVGEPNNFQRAPSDWGYSRGERGEVIPPSGVAE